MKNLFLSSLLLGLIFLVMPSRTQAQYTSPYIYTNNAYLNYAIASQKARATRARGRKNMHARKSGRYHRRKKRRTASFNINEQKYKQFSVSPKRIEVV